MNSFTRTAAMKVLAILATLSLVYLFTDAQKWDDIALTSLRASGGCNQTVIFRLADGKILATTNYLFVEPEQALNVAKGFLQPNAFTTFSVGDITYTKTKADNRTIHGKKAPGGIVCSSGGICCTYIGKGTSVSSIVSMTVLGDYFYQVAL